MKKLISLEQLKVGTKLKIVGKCERDSYDSISVKEIIKCNDWHEILINRRKNYYFHFERYIAGESLWVKEVYVLNGIDKRLREK